MARRLKAQTKNSKASKEAPNGEARLEWILAAASAVIVLFLMGVIIYDAVSARGSTPDIRLAAGDTYAMGESLGMDVTVTNAGSAPVSALEIEAAFGADGNRTTSVVTIDYLGSGSETKIGFGVPEGVVQDEITLRVVGYSYP